jgi:hypothetical protein
MNSFENSKELDEDQETVESSENEEELMQNN